MRGKLAAWIRVLVVLTALAAFSLALFDTLPAEVPPDWRDPIALLAIAAVLAAGVDLFIVALRSRRGARSLNAP